MVLTAFREERSKLERYREIARNKGLSRSASLRLHIAETIKDADREQAA